jgi:hypothetical protein
MNQIAIDLNNRGVLDLERGDPTSAFTSLSKAANFTMNLIENHQHKMSSNNNAAAPDYQFHWTNCETNNSNLHQETKDGCTPFLFLRALSISSPSSCCCPATPPQDEDTCACGYAWAIWFNLALCCSVLGTRLGEKGRLFLEMGNDLYWRVQRRVDSESSVNNSPHWQMLAMAISNNQACLFNDLSMQQASMECLQRLAKTLSSCGQDIEVEDRGDFCLNLQILGSSQTIAAAA